MFNSINSPFPKRKPDKPVSIWCNFFLPRLFTQSQQTTELFSFPSLVIVSFIANSLSLSYIIEYPLHSYTEDLIIVVLNAEIQLICQYLSEYYLWRGWHRVCYIWAYNQDNHLPSQSFSPARLSTLAASLLLALLLSLLWRFLWCCFWLLPQSEERRRAPEPNLAEEEGTEVEKAIDAFQLEKLPTVTPINLIFHLPPISQSFSIPLQLPQLPTTLLLFLVGGWTWKEDFPQSIGGVIPFHLSLTPSFHSSHTPPPPLSTE